MIQRYSDGASAEVSLGWRFGHFKFQISRFILQTCERRLEHDHACRDGGQPQEEDVPGEEDARLAQVAFQDLVVVHYCCPRPRFIPTYENDSFVSLIPSSIAECYFLSTFPKLLTITLSVVIVVYSHYLRTCIITD